MKKCLLINETSRNISHEDDQDEHEDYLEQDDFKVDEDHEEGDHEEEEGDHEEGDDEEDYHQESEEELEEAETPPPKKQKQSSPKSSKKAAKACKGDKPKSVVTHLGRLSIVNAKKRVYISCEKDGARHQLVQVTDHEIGGKHKDAMSAIVKIFGRLTKAKTPDEPKAKRIKKELFPE